MTDVTALLQSALIDEPPASFTPVDILEKARSARRRRHGFALAGTSGVAAGVVALVLVLGGTVQGNPPRLAAQLSLAALEHTAATGRVGHSARGRTVHKVGRVSTSDLAALVEQDTGVTLADIDITALPPAGVINMSEGIAVTGDPYLNVQVAPPHTMDTTTPSCAELSDLNSGSGDGFYGPCSITQQPDGSTLVVRSGETATGGYTMALALLIRPDGSGIFAETRIREYGLRASSLGSRRVVEAAPQRARTIQRPAGRKVRTGTRFTGDGHARSRSFIAGRVLVIANLRMCIGTAVHRRPSRNRWLITPRTTNVRT